MVIFDKCRPNCDLCCFRPSPRVQSSKDKTETADMASLACLCFLCSRHTALHWILLASRTCHAPSCLGFLPLRALCSFLLTERIAFSVFFLTLIIHYILWLLLTCAIPSLSKQHVIAKIKSRQATSEYQLSSLLFDLEQVVLLLYALVFSFVK